MTQRWERAFAHDGAWRLHPNPDLLPRRPRFQEDESAINRFDDPAGLFQVRYLGTTLAGCLIEVLSANFRVRGPIEERLALVSNAEPQPGDLEDVDEGAEIEAPGQVPRRWLEGQRVGALRLGGDLIFCDAMDAWFLAAHAERPKVRRALDRHLGEEYDLDAGTILLNLDRGRPVTQAVSAEVAGDGYAGIRYVSRLDITQECWAVYGHVPAAFDVQALDPRIVEHREAVTLAAGLLRLALPDDW